MRFSAGVQGYFLTEVRKGGETAQKPIGRRVIASDDDRLGQQEAPESKQAPHRLPYTISLGSAVATSASTATMRGHSNLATW